MRLLKGLLGKPKAKQPIDPAQAAQFDQEWAAALKRFGRVAGFESFAFDLKHPQTMQPLQPHEGLGGTFEDWKQITAPWDRQRLLMDLILSSTKGAMKPWQVANVLVALRLPQNALQLLKQSDPPPQEDTEAYSGYCESYARALQYLQQPHEALPWIEKSLSVTQNHLLRQRHADILYLTGECEPALKLYTELIEGLELSAAPHDAAIPVLFASLFAFDTGRIPSPVLAVDVGEKLTDAQQSATFWQLGEAEFYDSAFFRMHHGYVLAKQGEPLRCLANWSP
ncbi:MAG: tetratricopeptide repeat protein [Armatimonadetes bacterium]|nr:tetratricopeptide repeat protein [Anaerolineae bacterium]